MAGSLVSKYSGNQLSLQVNGVDKLLINSDGSLLASASPATGDRSLALVTTQKFADEFGAVLSDNGYQKFPSGLIIQWGTVSMAASDVTVTFPIVFPQACMAISGILNGTNDSATLTAQSVTTTSFAAGAWFTTSTTTRNTSGKFFWIAIGY